MKKIERILAEKLHPLMSEPDGWGILRLPKNLDITFDFTNMCQLELRQSNKTQPGYSSVINKSTFSMLKHGVWITVEMFEEEIKKLLQDITFTDEDLAMYL